MNCPFCEALNSSHDHRCVRCGRRLYLSAGPIRGSAAAALRVDDSLLATETPTVTEPGQGTLFPREPMKVVPMRPVPSHVRRETLQRVAHARLGHQPSLPFGSAGPATPIVETNSIYCDATVAMSTPRGMAFAIDSAMVLLAFSLFLGIAYSAGIPFVRDARTLIFWSVIGFVTINLYRILWACAETDSIGTRASGLVLLTFDGEIPDRRQRLIRLLASYVSLGSAGIGYLWALADEEKLTWHDHISKTFPAPQSRLRSKARKFRP